MSEKNYLKKEDYEEPCCVLKKPTNVTPVPVGRVIGKLDEYLEKQDFAAAERHLKYWLAEAEAGNDERGRLAVLNEQIGLYRKLGKGDESVAAAEEALQYAVNIGLGNTVTMGTTLVNAATAFKAFGRASEALPLYEKAAGIYEELLKPDDERLGALCNNMALTLMELKKYGQAEAMFNKALSVMENVSAGEIDQAITFCNLADLAAEKNAEGSDEAVAGYLEKAMQLLDSKGLKRDGYYAFVCDKCASAFAYHGYFIYEEELKKRAEEIYERA